jgi:hypothetical protein
MDGAQSIASVLHTRLQRLALPQFAGHDLTWAQRTPATAPTVAHELAAALDARTRAFGGRLAASPEPWLARHLGVLAPAASPTLRKEYARRAAAYRETAGITDPQQPVSLLPHRSSPELEDMRLAAVRALEIRDEADILRGLTHGELEARTLAAERAQASAPPDVSRQLRLTAQAEADTWQQSAEATTRHDQTEAADAKALAGRIAVERQQLEAANARYEQWSAATTSTREKGDSARAELEHRGLIRQSLEPSQPQAANEPEADTTTVDAGFDGANHQAARRDELLTHAAAAARRIAADRAGRETRAGYAARVEREAQVQPGPTREARASTTWKWSCKPAGAAGAGHDRSCLTRRDLARPRRRESGPPPSRRRPRRASPQP